MAIPVLSMLNMAFKVGKHIYNNKQQTKMLISDAQRVHAEKMSRGEINIKAKLSKVTIKDLKMNSFWFLYPCLFCYWLILFLATLQIFVYD